MTNIISDGPRVGCMHDRLKAVVGRVVLGVAVLSMYSVRGHADPPAARCDCDQTPRRFLAIGYGMGGESRLGSAAAGRDMGAYAIELGQRLGGGLHLVEQLDLIPSIPYFSDPTLSEAHMTFLAGVRWAPFGRNPRWQPSPFPYPGNYFDPTAFYFAASVGAGFRERTSPDMDDVTWTPVGAAHVGYIPIQGRDWALGFEWREQLEHYREGFQRGWSLLMTAELY